MLLKDCGSVGANVGGERSYFGFNPLKPYLRLNSPQLSWTVWSMSTPLPHSSPGCRCWDNPPEKLIKALFTSDIS